MIKKKILCIVPARFGSKGLKKKNIIKLGKYPLIAWPIKAALKCKYIDKVIVSTDSKKIAAIAENYGAEVPFLRPTKLSTDKVSTVSVIKHALNFFKKKNIIFNYVLCLECTSPFTSSKDINLAINLFFRKKADSLIGVGLCSARHPDYLFYQNNDLFLSKYINKKKYLRRQNLKNIFFIDGSLYLSKVQSLFNNNSFISKRTLPYIMPKHKSFEIDDKIDLLIYKTLLKNNYGK
jgi:N-acylneuraminate cytidylyltransferase/CMP-N,N'-diacetyllegionaminic acid synthase